jgi:hypothetical protein
VRIYSLALSEGSFTVPGPLLTKKLPSALDDLLDQVLDLLVE